MRKIDDTASFADRADDVLARVEHAVDALADDVDIDVLRTGNVVTLTFENGHRIIVNTQAAVEEIWVAARSGGFHYRFEPGTARWLDTRSAEDLRLVLARLIGAETGTTPTLAL